MSLLNQRVRGGVLIAAILCCFVVPPSPAVAARHVFVGLQRDGVAGVTGLAFAFGIGMSPDGQHLYVGDSFVVNRLTRFTRDLTTGGILFDEVAFDAGMIRFAVSPDGLSVYGQGASRIHVFSRDALTGALTLVEDEVQGGSDLAVSPDGLHVYQSSGAGLVRAYDRDGITGALTFIEEHEDGVSGVDGLDVANGIVVSPDGEHVYVSASGDHAIAVFSRNAGTGELTFVEFQQEGMGGVDGLITPEGVRVSPDGKHVYASGASGGTGGVAAFSRDAGTGALTFLAHATGGGAGRGRLALSPDGTHVYLLKNSSMGIYTRDSVSGALVFEEVLFDGLGGYDGLGSPEDVVVSPDSRHVYVAAGESTVAAFQRVHVACSPAPLGGCFAPTVSQKALLVVKDNATDAKDKLVWKWLKGEAVTLGDFGDPPATANDYALCVYDGTANPQPIAELLAPAGGGCGKAADGGGVACWQPLATKGFRYKRKDTHPDGVVAAKLLAGGAGSAKIVLKAKKDFTPTPGVPVTLPVTVQLQNAAGTCWSATYSAALRNADGLFKAKAD